MDRVGLSYLEMPSTWYQICAYKFTGLRVIGRLRVECVPCPGCLRESYLSILAQRFRVQSVNNYCRETLCSEVQVESTTVCMHVSHLTNVM